MEDGMRPRTVRRIIVASLIGGYCMPLGAEPPADAQLAPWFKSLRQPRTNQSCCDMADCRVVQYRKAGDHFPAFIGDGFPRWPNLRTVGSMCRMQTFCAGETIPPAKGLPVGCNARCCASLKAMAPDAVAADRNGCLL
jgi:hypothetical protein